MMCKDNAACLGAETNNNLHSYRCKYVPKTATFESGVTREIQVKAFNSIDAMQRAHLITGRQIIEAARFEPS